MIELSELLIRAGDFSLTGISMFVLAASTRS